jgi:hypothetical protein
MTRFGGAVCLAALVAAFTFGFGFAGVPAGAVTVAYAAQTAQNPSGINTAEGLRAAFASQAAQLNTTFSLNVKTSLDIREILQNANLGLTACRWSYTYRVDARGNRIMTEYTQYNFTAEFRDDFRIARAYGNERLTRKLTAREREVMAKAQSILARLILPGMNDYEKALAIHDYVVLNARYTLTSDNPALKDALSKAEGVLLYGMGTCASYAGSVYLLLNMAGIECLYVSGTGTNGAGVREGHAWNKAKLGGEWYNIDATWDDPVPDKAGAVSRAFFCVTDAELARTHGWDAGVFPQAATATAYNYYVYNNLYASGYEEFKAIITAALLRQKGQPSLSVRLYVENYDRDAYGLGFISNIVPGSYTLTYTLMKDARGEFFLEVVPRRA